MHKYCKAYHLKNFRQFDQWQEKQDSTTEELTDETIAYLWDDFTVVLSPVQSGGVLFDAVTPAWQAFCTETLHFAIPEDLRYAYETDTEKQDTATEPAESAAH